MYTIIFNVYWYENYLPIVIISQKNNEKNLLYALLKCDLIKLLFFNIHVIHFYIELCYSTTYL